MLTPTDKAVIEGLIQEWRTKQATYLKAAKRNARHGNTEVAHEHSMSATDVGGYADELEQALQRLLSGETREAETWLPPELLNAPIKWDPTNDTGQIHHPSPHDDAGAVDIEAVLDAIDEVLEASVEHTCNRDDFRRALGPLLRHTHAPQTAGIAAEEAAREIAEKYGDTNIGNISFDTMCVRIAAIIRRHSEPAVSVGRLRELPKHSAGDLYEEAQVVRLDELETLIAKAGKK